MKPAVFLDRDGTIIEDTHYIRDPALVKFIPEAIEALKEIAQKGYLIFIVSNQSGVGRGIIKDDEFWSVHQRLCGLLKENEASVDEFLYCFHHPQDGCQCRKPSIGLLPKSFAGTEIDFKNSFSIGDKECDVLLGRNAGGKGLLVLSGSGKDHLERVQKHGPPEVFENLKRAAEFLPKVANDEAH